MPVTASPRVHHLAIAREFAARPDQWPSPPRFDPARRWYQRLAVEGDAEVWLLTWLPGQRSDLHDHGGSEGAFVVVTGELTETTVATRPVVPAGDDRARFVSRTLAAGEGRRFGPRHVHEIVNAGDRPAISVHVYGPALTTMTRYRIEAGRLVVSAVDRAGAQW